MVTRRPGHQQTWWAHAADVSYCLSLLQVALPDGPSYSVQNMRAYRCPITPAPSMWDASSTKARFSFTDILKMAHTAATQSRIWATASPHLYWRTYWYAVTDTLLNEHTARIVPLPSLTSMQANDHDLRPELDRRQRAFIGMEEYYTEQIDKFEIAEKQIQAAVLALLAHWKKGATINPML